MVITENMYTSKQTYNIWTYWLKAFKENQYVVYKGQQCITTGLDLWTGIHYWTDNFSQIDS